GDGHARILPGAAATAGAAAASRRRVPQSDAGPAFAILSPMQADPVERALRGLYVAALYLLVPITVYHLIWRGFRQREYFQRWHERYAVYADAPQAATLWVHAVSVGEVNAAAPLVNALRARY